MYHFKLAADQNNPIAQLYVGVYHIDFFLPEYMVNLISNCVYYDDTFGYTYFINLIKNNIYKILSCKSEIDYNKGIDYIYKAAQQNNSDAQCILGMLYINHPVIVRNIPKGMYFLTLSANQNNSSAQLTLELFYLMGMHVKPDKNKAKYYLTLSANQNNLLALFYLTILKF